MKKIFEINELDFILSAIVHTFKIFLLEYGHIRLNSIPDINAFTGEIITEKKDTAGNHEILIKIKPTGWPPKCHLRIRLKKLIGNWVPDNLIFYYPEVIDRVIKFNFTNKTTDYKLAPSGDLDEKIINKFIKSELIN